MSDYDEYVERDRKAVLAAAKVVFGSDDWRRLNDAIQTLEWQVANRERNRVAVALAAIDVRTPREASE